MICLIFTMQLFTQQLSLTKSVAWKLFKVQGTLVLSFSSKNTNEIYSAMYTAEIAQEMVIFTLLI